VANRARLNPLSLPASIGFSGEKLRGDYSAKTLIITGGHTGPLFQFVLAIGPGPLPHRPKPDYTAFPGKPRVGSLGRPAVRIGRENLYLHVPVPEILERQALRALGVEPLHRKERFLRVRQVPEVDLHEHPGVQSVQRISGVGGC
jgi:hypothetical protein